MTPTAQANLGGNRTHRQPRDCRQRQEPLAWLHRQRAKTEMQTPSRLAGNQAVRFGSIPVAPGLQFPCSIAPKCRKCLQLTDNAVQPILKPITTPP